MVFNVLDKVCDPMKDSKDKDGIITKQNRRKLLYPVKLDEECWKYGKHLKLLTTKK